MHWKPKHLWFTSLWHSFYCSGLEPDPQYVCLYFSLCMSLRMCMSVSHSPGVNGLLQDLWSGRVGWAVLMSHPVSDQCKNATSRQNRCPSKPHTMNRFPHDHMTAVIKVGGYEEEEQAGSFGVVLNLQPASFIPLSAWQTTHASLILHDFHPRSSPWDISRKLNASFHFLLCRNHSSWEPLLQLPLIFMFNVQLCKGEEMRECGWWLRKLGKYLLLCLEFSPWIFKTWPGAVLALIFWLLYFPFDLSHSISFSFLVFALRVPMRPKAVRGYRWLPLLKHCSSAVWAHS